MKARAFCPGHVTGFFSIEDSGPIILKKGSTGAGFCLKLGAYAEVLIHDSKDKSIQILLNEKPSPAPVTMTALEDILGDSEKEVIVKISTELPHGQGFGMSAAGTFAAAMALSHALTLEDERNKALRATHSAEVKHHTGLGDAVAQNLGNFVVRTKPGVPPFGEAKRYDFDAELIFCTIDKPIKTSQVLKIPEMREKITGSGRSCMSQFMSDISFSNFMDISWKFTRETGLAGQSVIEAVSSVHESGIGKASMSMLGNTVFATGDTREIANCLGSYGELIKTKIEGRGGVRLLV